MNRTLAPKFIQAQDLEIVFPEKITLHNGAVLYWQKDVKDDAVKLDIEWNAGSKYQDRKLNASFTSKMLLAGSDKFSARQIAEEIDFYGGYSQTETDKDHAGIVLFGLAENIGAIFDVFNRAFDEVQFPEAELNKERNIALNRFKVESQKVKTLCQRAFTKNLFGEESHYGQVANESDFLALNRQGLMDFFQKNYSSAPVLFLTGRVDDAFINKLTEWTLRFNNAPAEKPAQRFTQTTGSVLVPKEDALQTAIRIGRLMFKKDHPDYFRFQLLNTVLGGYFGSRLMANIREDKGYTYGIGSGMAVMQDAGYFYISTEVGKDVKEKAIAEIFLEMDKLKNERIGEDELVRVKNYMLGEFLRQADGPIAMMEIFKNLYFNDLQETYYSDFISAVHAATAEDLRVLANEYFVREQMLEVIAG